MERFIIFTLLGLAIAFVLNLFIKKNKKLKQKSYKAYKAIRDARYARKAAK